VDRDHDNRRIKQDFRQVASSVKQLSAHAASVAREWINERKQDMANRNDRNDPDRTRNGNEQTPSRGYNNESYRGSEYNQNEPLRGYGEGTSQGAQGTYGVHQREDVNFANREHEQAGQWRSEPRNDGSQSPRQQQAGSQQYGAYSQQSPSDRGYGQASANHGQQSTAYAQQASSQGDAYRPHAGSQQGGGMGRDEYSSPQYTQPRNMSQGSYGAGEHASQGYDTRTQSQRHDQSYNTQQSHAPSGGLAQSSAYGQPSGYGQSSGYSQPNQSGSSAYGQPSGYNQQQGQGYAQSNRGNESGSTIGNYGQEESGYRGKGPKGYTRSDERIQEDLNERLFHDDEIDASDIELKVNNGVVCLDGTVDERRLKYRIEDIAESCSGVKDVTNNLRVKSSSAHGSASTTTASLSSGSAGSSMGSQSGGSLGGSDTGIDKTTASKPASGSLRGNAT